MTREELQDVATRVCLAIAAGADIADVFADARAVAVGLATIALDDGALLDPAERRRAGDRRRQERRRARLRDSVTPESRLGHDSVTPKTVTGRDKSVTETVTKSVTGRDTAPPQTPLPEEHPLSSPDSDETKRGEARARAEDASRSASRSVTAESRPDDTRWCALLKVFERVVHNGAPSVPHAYARLHLTNLLPALDARARGKPLEFFEAVLVPYDAAKRAKGDVAQLEFFCRDFARCADRRAPSAPPEDVSEAVRKLKLRIAEAERETEMAETDEDHARWLERAELLRAELEQLTSRAA